MTHPKIKALEQDPCEMTVEEYRQRMIQAFHNADTDELIAVCVLPTEKEFEHLEWLLKNHYKKEMCEDAIDRKLVSAFIAGLISDDSEREKGLEYIRQLPSVEQEPKILEAIDFAINASDGDTPYFVGFRNGLRYSKLLIDGEVPQFEHCTEQEPKTGHWIPVYQGDEIIDYRCSECEFGNTFGKGTIGMNFCPVCGAKMVEPQERSDKG